MPSGFGERYDFFLSRRGSVAAIAREVTDVLTDKGYKVLVQDYDIPLGASFVEAMHEAIINSRDLIILLTEDYLRSPYTRKEFTSFEAERVKTSEERHIIVLRCEDVPLRGLLADNVYQTLVGIEDPEERKRRIIAAAERQSQAAPPPPRPFIGVPPRIASFTGRVDELDRLDAILMHDKPAAVTQASVGRVAVQGVGGVGKTSLAIEYAHRLRGLYAGVCWCPSETHTGLLSALAGLAVSLGAATAEEADVEKAAKTALRRLAEQRATWLLVYDNVSAPDAIADLLPSAGARVLITSRFSDWSEIANEVALDVLPLEEAVALLESRTGRSDVAGAKILAEALGCLPLALDHAGAYCKRTQVQFGDYSKKASSLINAAPRGAGYPRSVAATFDIAITEAVAQCQAAEALMAYFAQCAPERIPMILIEGAIEDEAQSMEALVALTEVSLVKHDPFEDGTPGVTVHRLVQAVKRARSEANGSAQDAVRRLIARLVAIYPEEGYNDPQSWPLCAKLTPHLVAQRAHSLEEASVDPAWLKLLRRVGNYFSGRAAFSQSKPLFDAAWLELLRRAGNYFRGRAAYSQSEPLFRDALAICEKALGSRHPETDVSRANLATLLREQGTDFHDALMLQAEATKFSPRSKMSSGRFSNTPSTHDEAMGLNYMAVQLRAGGLSSGARNLLEPALKMLEIAAGPEHRDTAMGLHNLASALQDLGDFAGARPLYERALAIREKVLGPEHRDTAMTLNYLASVLQSLGDVAGAHRLCEQALTVRSRVLGPEHPDTAMSLNNLGNLLRAQGDLAEAQVFHERALAIREKVLGPEHPDTAMSRHDLAEVLQDWGELTKAEPLYERALSSLQKALTPHKYLRIRSHPKTNRVRCNLSRLYLRVGRLTEALALARVALADHREVLGRDHAWTKCSAQATADALDALNRSEEAKALRERYCSKMKRPQN